MTTDFFTLAQLQSEAERCLFCAEKPCMHACPSHCSPADFLMAVRSGEQHDLVRAAVQILSANPMGETCGLVCPDTFCMAACSRKTFDRSIEIPKAQASIIHLARPFMPALPAAPVKNEQKIAIVGAGPAGLSAAAVLARKGFSIHIFEQEDQAGGAAALIPAERLPKNSLAADVAFVTSLGDVTVHLGTQFKDENFDAVLYTTGQCIPNGLGIPGSELTVSFRDFLRTPQRFGAPRKVAIVGGGAVAVDCALTAQSLGARDVELFVRRGLADMPLTQAERTLVIESNIEVTTRSRLSSIVQEASGKLTLCVEKNEWHLSASGEKKWRGIPQSATFRADFDLVIVAAGAQAEPVSGFYIAGDALQGETTVVEAVASGKEVGEQIATDLNHKKKPNTVMVRKDKVKSLVKLDSISNSPISLECHFLGLALESPFLLSAAPATDGFEQMKLALEAGWAGAIMKTAFHDVPIHIPNGYMHTFGPNTYGNCDNVSGHSLMRVCSEIQQLRKLFPHKLIAGSTGGSVSQSLADDKITWQRNTKMLEDAGAQLVEYSLSCPQGGDGSEGAIVSQNAAKSAQIIDWVLESGRADVPKLFKLSGAVTSIASIVKAIDAVFKKYPHKKAGITLANSFPALAFQKSFHKPWDEGVVVGLSGEAVAPITYLSLANVAALGVAVSGNGGAMNPMAAAHFLALGCGTVQFCTIAMKYGVGIINDLHQGLSHILAAKGMKSVAELVGSAGAHPITDFMALSAEKEISDREEQLCVKCGNCSHCGYQAITLANGGYPTTDPSRCVGCSICVKTCFAGAMKMRVRTAAEKIALVEH